MISLSKVSPTWVGAVPEHFRLIPVRHKVLDMSHLVVSRDQILHRHLGTHLYPVNNTINEIEYFISLGTLQSLKDKIIMY